MTKNMLSKRQDLSLGSYDELKRLATRIKLMVKGGDKLSDNEAMALAQVSTVTRLNPFIGEIWYIPGKGPMVGIAGARRNDNENTEKKGGRSWPVFVVVSPEEAGATTQEIKEGISAAYRCEINDSFATEKYQQLFSSTLEALRQSEVKDPFAHAKEICGDRPVWVGYGYSLVNEKSQMNKLALAKKRAEADALKRRIVIPFGGEVSDSDVSPYYDVDAEGVEMEYPNLPKDLDAAEAEIVAEVKRTEKENLKQLGFEP